MTETAAVDLRFLADAYEQSQRLRIETGERIRAVVQGRDETWSEAEDYEAKPHVFEEVKGRVGKDKPLIKCRYCGQKLDPTAEVVLDVCPDLLLKDIAAGHTDGPVPILGRTYRRHWQGEREMFGAMRGSLEDHPCWPWLERVKGIGPTLACKILARLDIDKAEHPSSFFSYCGLGTVPADGYRCSECHREMAFPVGYKVSGTHAKLGSTSKCKGKLELVPGNDARCAQPRPSRGQQATYDQYAKKTMYLIGCQFVKTTGAFRDLYDQKRRYLDRERPGWTDGRKHLTALRHIEKLFLSMLWEVWREAIGKPAGMASYAFTHLGHDKEGYISPQEMIEPIHKK